jgi:hypothetical protein
VLDERTKKSEEDSFDVVEVEGCEVKSRRCHRSVIGSQPCTTTTPNTKDGSRRRQH